MSNFIKIELSDSKDPNGTFYINTEQISWIANSLGNAKVRLNSGDIFSLKKPTYSELSKLLDLPSDEKKG